MNKLCTVYWLCVLLELIFIGPPEFPDDLNQTVAVDVSEEVILNCTVSASPDPVYNWFMPDSCSSCPHSHNKSVMIINADVTDNEEYICMAENRYGNVSIKFNVHMNCK